MEIIKTIIYNKRFSSDTMGCHGVISIEYDELEHPGAKESILIKRKGGKMNRIYDMDEVILYESDTQ